MLVQGGGGTITTRAAQCKARVQGLKKRCFYSMIQQCEAADAAKSRGTYCERKKYELGGKGEEYAPLDI